MRQYKLEILIIFLLIASVSALVLNSSCPRTFKFEPNSDWSISKVDDRPDGGNSTARAKLQDDRFELEFEIKKGHSTPYTGMTITPKSKQQIDLSWMEEFSIVARCQVENGPADNFFYFEVRTFEDGISSKSNHVSRKYNEAVIQTSREFAEIHIKRDHFSIPAWWTSRLKVPLNQRQPSFDKVEFLDFTSVVPNAPVLKGKLEVKSITAKGHWVSQSMLSQSLLFAWMLAAGGVLFARILLLRRNLRRQQKKEDDLLKLNEVLEIQSKELASMVSADPLTGLLNRRGARDFVFDAKDDLASRERVFSLIMLDIDCFKEINDNRGHLAGDQILCDLATIVRKRTRTSDAVSRWGGEEFLIICPDTDNTEAAELAESLRTMIEASELKYTASFGVCSAEGFDDFGEVLEAADKAMYFSKDHGRNQVTTYAQTLNSNRSSSSPVNVFKTITTDVQPISQPSTFSR